MFAAGLIALNYVAPHARFRGVSKALIARLESIACEHGLAACRLESTKTALRLYESLGYLRDDSFALVTTSGVTAIPLSKSLHRFTENGG